MSRTGWKWTLGISLVLLILLAGLLLFLYGAGVLLFTMFAAGTGQELPEFQTLWEFYADFSGSPMFWFFLADAAVLLVSTVMLLLPQKK